ncbi:MAG: hypothetical protein M1823_003924 [Watsoniomyces obsoletus]|nr:MAG: hypothetical protein M1823_003924 [Watsoniomyces obsoletus]
MVATVGFDEGVDALERIIYTKLAYREQSLKRRRRWKRLLGYLKSFLKMGWFLLCTPYISYAVLQRLGLVPATPIIPGLRVFSRDYLTCLSRFGSLPTEWTPPAVESWISALELSPLLRLCASAYMKNQADNFLVPVIQRSLSSISFPGIFWASTRTQKAGSRDEQPEAQEKSTISQPRTGLGAGLLMRFQSMREAILQGFRRQEASPTATATALPFEEENQQHQDAPNTPIASATVPSSPNHNEIDMAQTTPSLASHESSPMEPPVTGIRLAHHRGDDSGTALLELEVTRLQRRHGRSSSNDNSNQDLRQIPRLDSSREPDTDPDVSNFTTKPWAMPLRWLRDWASEDVAALLLIPIKAHFLRTLTVSFLAAEGLGNIRARAEPLTSPTGLGVSSSQARWSVEEIRLWLESPLSLALMRRVGETFLIDILLGIGVSGIGYLGIWWYTSRYLKEEEPETLVEQEQEQEHEHHEV